MATGSLVSAFKKPADAETSLWYDQSEIRTQRRPGRVPATIPLREGGKTLVGNYVMLNLKRFLSLLTALVLLVAGAGAAEESPAAGSPVVFEPWPALIDRVKDEPAAQEVVTAVVERARKTLVKVMVRPMTIDEIPGGGSSTLKDPVKREVQSLAKYDASYNKLLAYRLALVIMAAELGYNDLSIQGSPDISRGTCPAAHRLLLVVVGCVPSSGVNSHGVAG